MLGVRMSEKSIETLWAATQAARETYMVALAYTDQLIADVPTGIPGDDGALIMKRAGALQTAAFQNYRDALDAYSDALARQNQKW